VSVTDLRDLFEELTREPAPPTRSTAEATYAEGRRRWRRRRAVTAAAATVLAAVTAGGIALATAPTASGPADPAAAPAGAVSGGMVVWTGAADARHLYVGYAACPDGSCPKWIVRLVGSDDGGRTWTERAGRVSLVGLDVLGPRVLVQDGPAPSGPSVSTDGGRTWRSVGFHEAPRSPDGGMLLYCATTRHEAGCELTVLDPAAGTHALLARPPALALTVVGPVYGLGGAAWMAGTDGGRPAVAVSRDDGRTWSTHTFPEPAGCADHLCEPLEVATVDGRTVFVVITDSIDRRRVVYRSVADGAWQRLAGADQVPYDGVGGPGSFVLADGTHVLQQTLSDRPSRDRVRFWALDGDTYRPIELDGLPDMVYPIRRTADGWYYTHTYGETRGQVYGSADGRHWTPITHP
jgi:hypothetical protein